MLSDAVGTIVAVFGITLWIWMAGYLFMPKGVCQNYPACAGSIFSWVATEFQDGACR